jgi:hypothetical protein
MLQRLFCLYANIYSLNPTRAALERRRGVLGFIAAYDATGMKQSLSKNALQVPYSCKAFRFSISKGFLVP